MVWEVSMLREWKTSGEVSAVGEVTGFRQWTSGGEVSVVWEISTSTWWKFVEVSRLQESSKLHWTLP